MSIITTERTVAEIVSEKLSRARVFELYGIDYCCGGKRPLGEICAERSLNADEIVQELKSADAAAPAEQVNFTEMQPGELCDEIVASHHDYLRRELPRLEPMIDKLAAKRGDVHPELPEVRDIYHAFEAEIFAHMMKEEQMLFPMIRQLADAESNPTLHCGSVTNPIRVMEMEHINAGDALAKMHELTSGYAPPEDACNTYQVMLAGLAELEENMHHHIHKENHILFPKAIERENELRARG